MSLDPISDTLTPFLERFGLARPDTSALLATGWAELAGEPWSTQARPAGLRNGELLVDVVDAATASLLRYRTGELLRRLDEKLGKGTVEVVRLRVTRQPF